MKKFNNKWIRAAIPALLIHCSIGTVYCWSTFKGMIAGEIGGGVTVSAVEWAFSIAIFFLGMSAAFLGNIVEKDIHKSSLIAAICFAVGMAGTGFFIAQKSLIGIYICYGVIMGIGLGTGYLSPVKTLMLWFKDNKGLATGLAVAGFGLAKTIATPIMEFLQKNVGLSNMFYVLAGVYFVMMFVGHLLLKKPDGWVEEPHAKGEEKLISMFKDKTFIGIWLMFFINITCGLALISQEKDIIKAIGLTSLVAVIPSITALFNAGGRLGFSAWADKLKSRNTVYKVIFILSIALTAATVFTKGITGGIVWLVIPLLFMVNAGYGGGFSNVPTLLSDNYGMKKISQIHGLVLSAWGFAGIAGNQLANFIVQKTGEWVPIDILKPLDENNRINPTGYQNVLYVTLALYVVALIISYVLVGNKKEKVED